MFFFQPLERQPGRTHLDAAQFCHGTTRSTNADFAKARTTRNTRLESRAGVHPQSTALDKILFFENQSKSFRADAVTTLASHRSFRSIQAQAHQTTDNQYPENGKLRPAKPHSFLDPRNLHVGPLDALQGSLVIENPQICRRYFNACDDGHVVHHHGKLDCFLDRAKAIEDGMAGRTLNVGSDQHQSGCAFFLCV